jgi:crossover junction endodeoxyribonuclease RuvC
MRILGIDPGSTATGYGVVERADGALRHVAHGTLRPPRGSPLAVRLHHLYRALAEVIEQHRPDTVAVEQVFVAASPYAALVLGQARGAVLAAVAAGGLPVTEYTPAQIKQGVAGSGAAAKAQVQAMVRRILALEPALASDAADALAAAIRHAHEPRLAALGVIGRRPRPRRRPRHFAVVRRRVP